MKCRYCKNTIEDGSLYCRYCGAQLFVAQKREISIPKPRQLATGDWTAQVMVKGKRSSVTASTLEEYEVKARAVKLKMLAEAKEVPKVTLSAAIDSYIEANENVLSPATIRGYNTIRKYRFQNYMDKLLSDIDWQSMVNEESLLCSAKTVRNGWGLIAPSVTAVIGEKMPTVHLPKTAKKETPFLNYEEIQVFLSAIYGKPGELAAILALHSLRWSEMAALTKKDISEKYITVNKALVPDKINHFVLKKTAKTSLSNRQIPIMIPRLLELLPKEGILVSEKPSTVYERINKVCIKAGLPPVGCHGLRRSFASLCYHLQIGELTTMRLGGWSNMQTVHNFYMKLSDLELNDDVKKLQNFYGFTNKTR